MPRGTLPLRVASTLVALLVATTACGSTAQVGGDTPGGVAGFADPELGAPGFAGGPAVSAQAPSTEGDPGASQASGSEPRRGSEVALGATRPVGDGGRAAPTRPGAGGAGVAGAAAGPGVTDDTILLGIPYYPGTGEGAAALGVEGIDTGDERANWAAVLEHVNAEGGIAGRQVEPVYFRDEGYSSQSQSDQAACALWTQDEPVFIIVGRSSPAMRDCAQRAGVLLLGLVFSSATTEVFQQYPNYVEVAMARLDRAAQVTVEGLYANGYYEGDPAIGIVSWDDPSYRLATERGAVATLERFGLSATDVRYIRVVESQNQLADASSQVSNAVLRFRTQGIDHVMILDGPAGQFQGTGLTVLFLKSASSQGYYPAYGFNNANSPEGGIDAGLWTREELEDSHLVTWDYNQDNPDNDPNPARDFCEELLAGHDIHPDNPNAWRLALFACDTGLFLQAAARAGGDTPTLLAMQDGVARLDRSYRSPFNFANRFSADRRDGAAAARNGVYQAECHCYRYTTPPYALP